MDVGGPGQTGDTGDTGDTGQSVQRSSERGPYGDAEAAKSDGQSGVDIGRGLYGGRLWERPPLVLRPVAWLWNRVVTAAYDMRRGRRSAGEAQTLSQQSRRRPDIEREKHIEREIAVERERRAPNMGM